MGTGRGEKPYVRASCALVERLEERRMLSAVLVKDVDQSAGSADPTSLVDVNGTLYFAAKSGATGNELWRSDGTAAGTVLVKDIRAGFDSSNPQNLVNVAGTLFFWASDEIGPALWKSDGTEEGTTAVLRPSAVSFILSSQHIAAVGPVLFFQDYVGPVWRTDGTSAGTFKIRNTSVLQLISCNGAAFFTANNQLWRSDGSLSGTTLVWDKSIISLDTLICAGNTLFFPANNGVTGTELWKSDGTTPGTVMVKDLTGNASSSTPVKFAAVGNKVYFVATANTTVPALFKSDGTPEGTGKVADGLGPFPGIGVGDTYFFSAGGELWESDGTAGGTGLVKDIKPGSSGSSPTALISFNGQAFFLADDGTHGYQLWKSDGTNDGTQMVREFGGGTVASFGGMVVSGGSLFFSPTSEVGRELWSSDGSEPGTRLVADIHTGTAGSAPRLLTPFNHQMYFATQNGLWVSDGTAAGTSQVSAEVPVAMGAGSAAVYAGMSGDGLGVELYKIFGQPPVAQLVKDINPGSSSSNPKDFLTVNGITYFTATNTTNGTELWRTDGTEEGTQVVKDIWAGSRNGSPYNIIEMDGNLYFIAFDGFTWDLWRSDGTAAGTVKIKNIGSPTPFVVMNHAFYFGVALNPLELWKSDGTTEGTVRVWTLRDYTFTDMSGLMAYKGRLYFKLLDHLGHINAWTSDGTLTAMLSDLVGEVDYSPGDFVPFGDKVAFLTGQVGYGLPALWLTDATPAGTYKLQITGFSGLVTNGPLLFFTTSNSGTLLSRLWKSDGTLEGTSEVRDLAGNIPVLDAKNYALLDGIFYFSSTTPAIGAELWKISPPHANAGNGYSVPAGGNLPLTDSASTDPDPAEILSFSWDLDGDGLFGETGPAASRGNETGATPTFFSSDLPPGTFPVQLRVTNSIGLEAQANAQITVTLPQFMTLSADAQIEWSGGAGARTLAVHGGNLTLNSDISSVYPGISLVVDNAATVHLPAVQHLQSLTLSDLATLDLAGGPLFIASQPTPAMIRGLIKSGRIFSSTAQGDSRLGIGYNFDAASGSVKIMPTLLGDLNLDAAVSIADFIELASHLAQSNANWFEGDLNYDDRVSIADFITLASNFGQSYAPTAPSPQPAAAIATSPTKARQRSARHHLHRDHGRSAMHWSSRMRRWTM